MRQCSDVHCLFTQVWKRRVECHESEKCKLSMNIYWKTSYRCWYILVALVVWFDVWKFILLIQAPCGNGQWLMRLGLVERNFLSLSFTSFINMELLRSNTPYTKHPKMSCDTNTISCLGRKLEQTIIVLLSLFTSTMKVGCHESSTSSFTLVVHSNRLLFVPLFYWCQHRVRLSTFFRCSPQL